MPSELPENRTLELQIPLSRKINTKYPQNYGCKTVCPRGWGGRGYKESTARMRSLDGTCSILTTGRDWWFPVLAVGQGFKVGVA